MGLPDPDYFTVVELAERWAKKYGECTKTLVERYITTKKLKAEEIRGPSRQRGGGFVDAWKREPVHFVPGPVTGYHITLDEVLRFEAENPPTNTVTLSTTKAASIKSLPVSKRRLDALGRILFAIRSEFIEKHGRTPQYMEVVNELRRLAKPGNHPVIQEVSEGKVYCRGCEKGTSFKQIQNRLTRFNSDQK